MCSGKLPAVSVDAAGQRTVKKLTHDLGGGPDSWQVPPSTPPDEIEIPLELVGCGDRVAARVNNARSRPLCRANKSSSSTTESPLSPLDEEELAVTSSTSSSSSSQSSSPDDDDPSRVGDDGRQLTVETDDVELDQSATASATSTSTTIASERHQHTSSPGLTARLGNLLNSAVMKAQKQLGRSRYTRVEYRHPVYSMSIFVWFHF